MCWRRVRLCVNVCVSGIACACARVCVCLCVYIGYVWVWVWVCMCVYACVDLAPTHCTADTLERTKAAEVYMTHCGFTELPLGCGCYQAHTAQHFLPSALLL